MALEIGLGLVEQLEAAIGFDQGRHQRFEIGRLDDVVGRDEALDSVAGVQLIELVDHLPGAFGAKQHAGIADAAERAVVLLAPPAAARGLDRNAGDHLRLETAAVELLEIVVVQRHRKLVHATDAGVERTVRRRRRRAVGPMARREYAGPEHRGRHVAPALEHRTAERRQELVGLARHHEIDPIETLVRHPSHLAFAVAAAEHGDDRRVELTNTPQQRQRRALLLEHRAAADDARAVGEHRLGHLVDEVIGQLAHAGELLRQVRWIAEDGGQPREIGLRPQLGLRKRGCGKGPFADAVGDRGGIDAFIALQPQPIGEAEVGVERARGDAGPLQAGLQRAERRRWALDRRIRHQNQYHLARRGHLCSD